MTITETGTQVGSYYIDNLSGSTGSLQVAVGATYAISGNSNIYTGAGTGAFVNAGSSTKTNVAGQSNVYVNVNSMGSIAVLGGTLGFQGVSNSLAGSLSDAGTAAFDTGTTTLKSGLALTVAQIEIGGGTLEFAAANSFAGVWSQNAGTVKLDSVTVTLSGSALLTGAINGIGTLSTTGAVTLSNTDIEGTTAVTIAGSAEQVSTGYLGYNTGAASALNVLAGATYQIDTANIYAGASATLNNAGTIVSASGVLTVSDQNSTASLHIGGAGYTTASFFLGQDANGGTGIFHT